MWDCNVGHAIRPDTYQGFTGGFLLPYHALLEAAETDASINPERYVAFAPEEAWDSFSYVAAHVSHDQAIGGLLECRGALERLMADQTPIPGRWDVYLRWIDDPYSGRTIYWEHLGMLDNPIYRQRWERKQEWYRQQGVLPLEANDNRSDLLVTTQDLHDQGSDWTVARKILDKLFGR